MVTLISKEVGKCVDFLVLSKNCKSCEIWSKRKDNDGYDAWKTSHQCKINHTKSAGSMESVGACTLFQRSVEKNKLRYTSYIGDGDTSSFSDVQKLQPYENDTVIEKKDCISHVQKRLSTRCRTLRQNYMKRKLSDGKGISGKGRLTDKAINTLQNYYGMAIRQNTNDLHSMKKAVGAVLYHCRYIPNENIQHQFCPRTADT